MKEDNALSKAKKRFIRGIYINREYSWLQFNSRVLRQANDPTNPLLEQCKFLSIFGSNLDEFFMVRVGSLFNENVSDPDEEENKTGLTPAKQLAGIMAVVRRLYKERETVYRALRKRLSKAGVRILTDEEITPRQNELCKQYFLENITPLLSLMVLDAKHPMIRFENMRHYMLYELERNGRRMIGVLYVNPAAERLFCVGSGKKAKVVPLEVLLRRFGYLAFTGYEVKHRIMLRVTRNADVDTSISDADDGHDFSYVMRQTIERRSKLGAVRVEVDDLSSPLCSFVL